MKKNRRKISEQVTAFAESVVKYGENILEDPVRANRHYDCFTKAMHDLAVVGDEGLSALAELLDDERVAVRVIAASYLVHFKTEKALKVLNAARDEDRAIAMLAIVTLKRWEKGSYLDPMSAREVKTKPKEQ